MPRILSTHPLHPLAVQTLGSAGDLVVASAIDQATIANEARGADVIIVRAPLPATLFSQAPRLRAAIRHGAGLDMIPIEAASAAGVLVANVPAVNARTVAEHVIMVTLALLRRFRVVDADLRRAGWNASRDHAVSTNDLSGRTIGIIGMGAVGQALAAVARGGFGLRVLGNSRSGRMPQGVDAVAIDAVLAGSDVVVLCCPLNDETRGMIDARRLALMKPDALLVNVARGPVVVEGALIEALRTGRLAGAALDVFDIQPLPVDHPLLAMPNVILTPHMAGITDESMARMGIGAAEEAVRVLSGALPVNLRNPDAITLYRARFPVEARDA